jgi:anhydro-N-acetylmuramic acid kinase
LRAIGLMSGTSFDGVDAALIETDGERIERFGPALYRPYSDEERAVLRQALQEAVTLTDRNARPGAVGQAESIVNRTHAEAVESLLAEAGLPAREIELVGFHGQTVIHKPQERLTVQVGDADALARRLGIPVVHDFRAADIAAGGQGAPLVPVFHRAIVETVRRPHPVAVLNIGGVANVTFCNGGPDLIACDTGPGNALIDDFMRARTGAPYDDNCDVARTGKPDRAC